MIAKKCAVDVSGMIKEIIEMQRIKNEFFEDSDIADPKSFSIEEFSMRPEEAVKYLDKHVIKQAGPKWSLATHLIGHINRIRHELTHGLNPMDTDVGVKSNIMLIGSTGVGKTFLIKLIARRIGAPFAKYDATKFSETGYVGDNVDSMARGLYQKAMDIVLATPKFKEASFDQQIDEAIKLAQFGIIYIDEIDKIAKPKISVGQDVSRGGVQRNLLSLTEEREVPLYDMQDMGTVNKLRAYAEANKGRLPEQKFISTKNIIFVFSGVFQGIDDIIANRTENTSIGFGAQVSKTNKKEIMTVLKAEDLVKYGFESELIGRIPIRVVMDELSEEDLYQILTLQDSVIVNNFIRTMEAYNIKAEIDDKVFKLIAAIAFKEKTGARGLVSAFNNLLEIFLGRLPSTGISSFRITEDLVNLSKEDQIMLLAELKKEMLEASGLLSFNDGVDSYLDDLRKEIGLRILLSKEANLAINLLAEEKIIKPCVLAKSIFSSFKNNFSFLFLHGLSRISFTDQDINDIEKGIKRNILESVKHLKFENGEGLSNAKKNVKDKLGLEIKLSKELIGEIYFKAMITGESPFTLLRSILDGVEPGLIMYKEKKGDVLCIDTGILKDPKTFLTEKIAGK